jgi:hypothetical protein
VLTKYTFDYVGVGLETSRRKSLKRLGQERGVSRMSARRATELLKLLLCRTAVYYRIASCGVV